MSVKSRNESVYGVIWRLSVCASSVKVWGWHEGVENRG